MKYLFLLCLVFLPAFSYGDPPPQKRPTLQQLQAASEFNKATLEFAGYEPGDQFLSLSKPFEQFRHRLVRALWAYYMTKDYNSYGNQISKFRSEKRRALRAFNHISNYYEDSLYMELLRDPLVAKYELHYFVVKDPSLIVFFRDFDALFDLQATPEQIFSIIKKQEKFGKLKQEAAVYFTIKKIKENMRSGAFSKSTIDLILSTLFKGELAEFAMAHVRFSNILDEDFIQDYPATSLTVAKIYEARANDYSYTFPQDAAHGVMQQIFSRKSFFKHVDLWRSISEVVPELKNYLGESSLLRKSERTLFTLATAFVKPTELVVVGSCEELFR